LLAVSRSAVYRKPAEVSAEDLAIMALIDRQYRTIQSPVSGDAFWTPERQNQKRKIPVAEPPLRCGPARLLSSAPEPVAFSAQ
jgi:hypothetical protein